MSIFLGALHSFILSFVSKITIYCSYFSSWFANERQSLVCLKNQAHVKHKSLLSISDYRSFSFYRARYKFHSKQYYHTFSFISRTESSNPISAHSGLSFLNRVVFLLFHQMLSITTLQSVQIPLMQIICSLSSSPLSTPLYLVHFLLI